MSPVSNTPNIDAVIERAYHLYLVGEGVHYGTLSIIDSPLHAAQIAAQQLVTDVTATAMLSELPRKYPAPLIELEGDNLNSWAKVAAFLLWSHVAEEVKRCFPDHEERDQRQRVRIHGPGG